MSGSRFRLLETGAALGAAAASDITCAGSAPGRPSRAGNFKLRALVGSEQSFGGARRGAARLRASCGSGSRSSLGAAPRVWWSLVKEAHTLQSLQSSGYCTATAASGGPRESSIGRMSSMRCRQIHRITRQQRSRYE